MDNIKLYAKSEKEMKKRVEVIAEFNKDLG